MPAEVREAGGPGSPCCLFWPLPAAHSAQTAAESGGVWHQVTSNPFVHYVSLAAKVNPCCCLTYFCSFLHQHAKDTLQIQQVSD